MIIEEAPWQLIISIVKGNYLNEDGDGLSQLSIDTLLGANITGSYSDNATLNQYYELATQFSKDAPLTKWRYDVW